jgi:glycosyltransferase involved in cell wall biosynthesis
MRILYAVPGYKPAYRIGGPILSVAAAAEALVRAGHRVTVFTTNSNLDQDLDVPLDQPVDVEGVEVWYFRRTEWIKERLPFVPYLSQSVGFLYAPKMSGQLERLVPQMDLVHTHLPFIYPTYAAARAARRFRKPLFYNQRGVFDPARLRFRGLKKRLYIAAVEKPIMRSATTLIALTEAEIESYHALGMRVPVQVIPNGIDVSVYRCEPEGDPESSFGIPEDALVILFLGRLHPIKGADKLLEAFARVHRRNPRAFLVMAGPDEWNLKESFLRTARESSIHERVLFPGMVSGAGKLDLLARADLFSLPSDAEGFSMAVLEALASATPVLLSPGCHFPEVEEQGVGRISPTDAASLSSALEQMTENPEALAEMGRRGREFVARQYGWESVTHRLLETYREGLERFGAS